MHGYNHNFYEGHSPLEKLSHLFWKLSPPQKNTKPPALPLPAAPQRNIEVATPWRKGNLYITQINYHKLIASL